MMMYPQAKALCCDTHLPPALVVPMYVVNANVRGGVVFSIVCKGKHAPGFWVCNLHRWFALIGICRQGMYLPSLRDKNLRYRTALRCNHVQRAASHCSTFPASGIGIIMQGYIFFYIYISLCEVCSGEYESKPCKRLDNRRRASESQFEKCQRNILRFCGSIQRGLGSRNWGC